MKRALTLGLVLIATAASSGDLVTATTRARESPGPKAQWAPSGFFSTLHTRAVFEGKTRSGAGSYAREHRETAAAKSVWSYANLNPLAYTDADGRWGDRLDQSMQRKAERVLAACGAGNNEGCDAAIATDYRVYKAGIQAAGAAVHWAAWNWTEAAEGMLSIPTSTPGVYTSTPESRVVASGLGAGVEFVASVPVGIVGMGLMPEMIWRSPDEYRRARAEMREGQNSSNEELYLTGAGRLSGTIGLWAGAASIGMSRVPLLNEAPASQLFRSSNWSPQDLPPGAYQANSGLSTVYEYTGPRRLIYDKKGDLITRPNSGEPPPEAFEYDGRGVPAGGLTRNPDSVHYGVVYEAQLRRGIDFPGVDRGPHFAEANRQLYYEMQSDPAFATQLERLHPGINEGVAPGPNGAFPQEAPLPNLTWHHEAGVAFPGQTIQPRLGLLQLMLRSEHRAPGPVQTSLHPNGAGGMENWGW